MASSEKKPVVSFLGPLASYTHQVCFTKVLVGVTMAQPLTPAGSAAGFSRIELGVPSSSYNRWLVLERRYWVARADI